MDTGLSHGTDTDLVFSTYDGNTWSGTHEITAVDASVLVVVGLLAELVAVNRNLLERLDWRLQQVEESIERDKGS